MKLWSVVVVVVLDYCSKQIAGFPPPTSPSCRPNEHYEVSGSECSPSCSDLRPSGNCILRRVSGCFCDQGYVRSPQGNCVDPKLCPDFPAPPAPKDCPVGEIYRDCGPRCEPACDDLRGQLCFNDSLLCKPGCFCASGLVRSPSGDCIEPQLCPVCECPPNEVYDECGSVCPATCSNRFPSGKCTLECGDPGCVCLEGYVRAPDGTCINPQRCPEFTTPPALPVCPAGEVYRACGPRCAPSCADLRGQRCFNDVQCNPGCYCPSGLVRSPAGNCINPKWCPELPTPPAPPVCPAGEVYNACGPSCPASCDNQQPFGKCLLGCVPGCYCSSGLVRSPVGTCINPKWCPGNEFTTPADPSLEFTTPPPALPVCPAGEVYRACGPRCAHSCADLRGQRCYNNDVQCNAGCYCPSGLVRSPAGNCINPKLCPEFPTPPTPPVCPAGEIYNACGPSCPASCDNQQPSGACLFDCVPGCYCPSGSVRSPSGDCINPKWCPEFPTPPTPPVCPAGEIYNNCGPSCPASCDNQQPSGACLFDCIPGCYCPSGSVRSPSGDCIHPRWCPELTTPADPICPSNEHYDAFGPECPPSCFDLRPSGKLCSRRYIAGCVCDAGLVRSPDGICVEPSWCPDFSTTTTIAAPIEFTTPADPICPSNEHYDAFGPECPPSCFDLRPSGECSRRYIAGCVCNAGLVRSPDGICVEPSWCPEFTTTTISAPIRNRHSTTTISAPIRTRHLSPYCAGLENGIYGELCSPNFLLCWKGQLSLGDCPSNLYFSGGNGQGACVSLSKCALG